MNALGSMSNTRSRIPKVDCPQVISRVSGSNFSRTPTRYEQERYPVLAVHKASVSELSTFARGQTPRMRRRGAPRDNSLRQPLSFANSTFKKKWSTGPWYRGERLKKSNLGEFLGKNAIWNKILMGKAWKMSNYSKTKKRFIYTFQLKYENHYKDLKN